MACMHVVVMYYVGTRSVGTLGKVMVWLQRMCVCVCVCCTARAADSVADAEDMD